MAEDLARINFRLNVDDEKLFAAAVAELRKRAGYAVPVAVIVRALMGLDVKKKYENFKDEDRNILVQLREKKRPKAVG